MHIQRTASRLLTQRGLLKKGERGAAAVMMAMLAPVVIGFGGLALDTGLWYRDQRQVQSAADTAAIAGALEIASRREEDAASAAGQAAGENGFAANGDVTITVNSPPTSGASTGDPLAVEVIITEKTSPFFSAVLLGDGDFNVVGRAVARAKIGGGDACVLALDDHDDGAVTFTGSTTVNLPNCVVASNSDSTSSIKAWGSSTTTAQSFHSVGAHDNGGSTNVTLSEPARDYAQEIEDPFADLDLNLPSGPSFGKKTIKDDTTLSPGTYDGITVNSQKVLTLEPGTYYISGGDFTVHGQATVRCNCTGPEGITIIMTGDSATSPNVGNITINGGAIVDLNAPTDTSNPYVGVTFAQARSAGSNGRNKFNGGSTMNIGGAVYIPNQEVEWTGNNGTGAGDCTKVVARLVTFTGNSQMDNAGCEAKNVEEISTAASAVLME